MTVAGRRHVLALIAGMIVLVGSAEAAVEPQGLVLQRGDVPRGFVLDASDSGRRSNAFEAGRDDLLRGKLEAWGRLTGWEAQFDRGREIAGLSSRVDLFRSPAGARRLVEHYAEGMRRSGVRGIIRRRVPLGTEGWLWSGEASDTYAVVLWRHGRVFCGLMTLGLTGKQALALARVQEQHVRNAVG